LCLGLNDVTYSNAVSLVAQEEGIHLQEQQQQLQPQYQFSSVGLTVPVQQQPFQHPQLQPSEPQSYLRSQYLPQLQGACNFQPQEQSNGGVMYDMPSPALVDPYSSQFIVPPQVQYSGLAPPQQSTVGEGEVEGGGYDPTQAGLYSSTSFSWKSNVGSMPPIIGGGAMRSVGRMSVGVGNGVSLSSPASSFPTISSSFNNGYPPPYPGNTSTVPAISSSSPSSSSSAQEYYQLQQYQSSLPILHQHSYQHQQQHDTQIQGFVRKEGGEEGSSIVPVQGAGSAEDLSALSSFIASSNSNGLAALLSLIQRTREKVL
jgi:hypothetical protein